MKKMKCKYVPLPRRFSSSMSSQEVYADIADLASIPSKSQELLSFLIAHQILALDGSSFAVQEKFTKILIVFASFTERRTVQASEEWCRYVNLERTQSRAVLWTQRCRIQFPIPSRWRWSRWTLVYKPCSASVPHLNRMKSPLYHIERTILLV